MEENVYRTPAAEVIDIVSSDPAPKFYVVSPRKYWTLMIMTVGIYRLYWFYKHWAMYRARTGDSVWPFVRSLFSIFFTHSLFQEIEGEIGRTRSRHDWNWTGWATLYVVCVLAESISNRFERLGGLGPEVVLVIGLVALFGSVLAGAQAQYAANAACGDAEGSSNARFTIANWLWICLGAVVWALAFIGAFGLLPPD